MGPETALAAARGFREGGGLKLTALSLDLCLVGNAELIQTSPGLQGAGVGSCAWGGQLCMSSWSGDGQCPEVALATCRPWGLCHWCHHGAQLPSAPASRSQSLQAACAALALHTDPVLHPADPADLSQAGTGVSRAWLECLCSASSVRPRVQELAALRSRRLPSADVQLYLTIDPETEGAGS